MTLICKNICLHPEYAHKKIVRDLANTPYKKCSKCCLFIKYEGIYCPCCGVKLSNRAKNTIARRRRLELWGVGLAKRPRNVVSLDIVGLQIMNVHCVIMAWQGFQENLISVLHDINTWQNDTMSVKNVSQKNQINPKLFMLFPIENYTFNT